MTSKYKQAQRTSCEGPDANSIKISTK